MNRLQWLFDRFEACPAKPCLIWRDASFSYDWLLEHIRRWQTQLADNKVQSGTVVALEGDYSPQAIALLLALIDAGAIIVPLTASVAANKVDFMQIAETQVLISFVENETGLIQRFERPVRHPLTRRLIELGDPGLILFSSGSTGQSKAALHNFTALLEKFKRRRYALVTLTFLLFDHIGGVNTLLYVLSNTGTLVAVESRNPAEVCALIERYQVELLPTSPTFLNLLLISEAYARYDLSSLKRITYGTEVMPARTLERLHEILPQATLQQTYGLSEVGILRSKSERSDSLWVKVGGEGVETKVKEGILWIRSESAMIGYLNAPSPFDADGWFNTQDAVEVKGDYIKIQGRKSEVINVGGEKVYPIEVENVLLQMPNVRDAVVVGKANPITGQIVAAYVNLFEAEDAAQFRKRGREFCRQYLAPYKIPAKIKIVTEVSYNQRFKKIRRWE